jgi:hypothetical protein
MLAKSPKKIVGLKQILYKEVLELLAWTCWTKFRPNE